MNQKGKLLFLFFIVLLCCFNSSSFREYLTENNSGTDGGGAVDGGGDDGGAVDGGVVAHEKPSCACIYDIDSTLTTGGSGETEDIAIDARSSAESCIKAGCAIGVATGGTQCVNGVDSCKITKYSLGFNILDKSDVDEAASKLNAPIVTGEDWIVANWNKASAMETLSKKLKNPKCGILVDDNILQSCGECNAYTAEKGCPAPWGTTFSNLETHEPNLDRVKKAYSCGFKSDSLTGGTDYAWVPAKVTDVNNPDQPGKSQFGGSGMDWKNGAQQSDAQGIFNDLWNDVVDTDVIQNLGNNCLPSGLKFQKILNPTLPSTIPEKKKCDWETKVLNCDSDAVCENWANSEECKGVELTEKYCNYKGVCKFKTPN